MYKKTAKSSSNCHEKKLNRFAVQSSFHFADKFIDRNYYQSVVIKNEASETKLAASTLNDDKAETNAHTD